MIICLFLPSAVVLAGKTYYRTKFLTSKRGYQVKQQSRHFSTGGDDQHALTGVNVDASIADRIFGLLSVVRKINYTVVQKE